jgi:SNF2 family DNA or RNA helicase
MAAHLTGRVMYQLRSYQVDGVNWILNQYALGVGGILADEMGLGKTIQTLSFLSALKAAGLPGPHLVVTPLAVLQNWANEIKKFTPGLTVAKVQGSRGERDRILDMPAVTGGEYDVYLTTYETVLSEEAFFTESFLFHTITIDEGHRLKNEQGQLSAALARITVPFRLLLTGTPLQNNLNELWALMHYILPETLDGCKVRILRFIFGPAVRDVLKFNCRWLRAVQEQFETACNLEGGQLNRGVVTQARSLLESLMVRRVKSEVEKSLKPKLQYVLKVPLGALQRQWYRRFLQKDSETAELVSRSQLIAKMMQMQKVASACTTS